MIVAAHSLVDELMWQNVMSFTTITSEYIGQGRFEYSKFHRFLEMDLLFDSFILIKV